MPGPGGTAGHLPPSGQVCKGGCRRAVGTPGWGEGWGRVKRQTERCGVPMALERIRGPEQPLRPPASSRSSGASSAWPAGLHIRPPRGHNVLSPRLRGAGGGGVQGSFESSIASCALSSQGPHGSELMREKRTGSQNSNGVLIRTETGLQCICALCIYQGVRALCHQTDIFPRLGPLSGIETSCLRQVAQIQ